MTGRIVFQDDGTGLTNRDDSDWIDGASVGAIAHIGGVGEAHVVSGLGITPDFANDQVTVDPGQCRMTFTDVSTADHSGDAPRAVSPYTWDEVVGAVLVDGATLSISSTGVTDIYVRANYGGTSPDDVTLETSQPADPSLKIASVDADAQTVDELNRKPDGSFAALSAADHVTAEGRTDDPTLEAGRIWTRSDEDVIKASPDGSQKLRIGWTT